MLTYGVLDTLRTNDDVNREMEKVEKWCSSLKKHSRGVIMENLHLILKILW